MNPDVKRLAQVLTLAGAIPFLAAAAAILTKRLLLGFDPVGFAKVYSLGIAAFMAGTIWGYVIPNPRGRGGAALLVASNALALVVIFATGFNSPRNTFAVDLVVFLALLAIDVSALRLGWLARDYLRLRAAVSAVVAAALGLILISL